MLKLQKLFEMFNNLKVKNYQNFEMSQYNIKMSKYQNVKNSKISRMLKCKKRKNLINCTILYVKIC